MGYAPCLGLFVKGKGFEPLWMALWAEKSCLPDPAKGTLIGSVWRFHEVNKLEKEQQQPYKAFEMSFLHTGYLGKRGQRGTEE